MMRTLLAVAIALLLSPVAFAQHAGHVMPASQDATASEEEQGRSVEGRGTGAPARPSGDMATDGQQQTQGEAPVDPHAEHQSTAQVAPVDHSQMDHSQMDHSQMDHSQMDHSQMDHSQMDHSQMDHSQMGHSQMGHAMPAQDAPVDHAQMDHSQHGMHAPDEPIPPITEADRAAASFTGGHAAHDDGTYTFVLIDRLEATDGDHGRGLAWEVQAWTGKDIDKLWLRSEGERVEGRTGSADVELLYGRAISPWWDLVAGIRHDFKPGEAQSHAAIGVIGMAPYKFEVEATAYLSAAGDLSARLEAEYDTLLTNRLILQWLAEAELHGDDDPARGIGSGLSTIEAGLRLRYEIRREFAPYVGLVRERAFGDTAALRRTHGDPVDDTLVVAGVRIWF